MSHQLPEDPAFDKPSRLPTRYHNTMDANWFAAAAAAIPENGKISIFDWKPEGGRWINVSISLLDPRVPVEQALRRLLRAAGVGARRFAR
jgi:hypothetical protein